MTWDSSAGVAGTDRTLTRTESVTKAEKHVTAIKARLTYIDAEGNTSFKYAETTFDQQEIPEVDALSVQVDPSTGEVVVEVAGDNDVTGGYVTVGENTVPSDPTAASNDASWTGRSDSVSTGVTISEGSVAIVKVVGENNDGALGPVKQARGNRHQTYSGENATFNGQVDVEAGEGAPRFRADTTGSAGRIRLWNASNIVMAAIFVDADGAQYASDGDAILSGAGRAVLRGVTEGVWAGVSSSAESRILTLHKDLTSREVTGTTTETTLETVTVPATTLGTEGGLRIEGSADLRGSNSFKVVRIKFGGTTIATFSPGNVTGDLFFEVLLFNDGATGAQKSFGRWNEGTNGRSLVPGSSSIDTTLDQDLTITGDLDNTGDTIDLEMSFVEFLSTPV